MNTLRVWLLVLLTVLLPFRVAAAGGLGCVTGMAPAGVVTDVREAPVAMDHAAMGHDHAAMLQAMAAVDSADTASASHTDAAGAEKCKSCCDVCTLTPLLFSHAELPRAQALTTLVFSRFAAQAVRFVSDGPERPPRSL